MKTRFRARYGVVTTVVVATALVPVTAGTSQAAAASDNCGTVLQKTGGGAWSCTFVDLFDGRALDTTKWVVGDTSRTGFRSGATCYRADRGNVTVRRGALQITTKREKSPFLCRSPYGDFTTQYTGGGVSTAGRFSQTYGRFEIRARYPSTRNPGVHGGFWMHPQNMTYGAWPLSGEVDVAEWWSVAPDTMFPSLHYGGRTTADTGWNCGVASVDSWHTYALEWTRDEMLFYYDGRLCFRRSWTPDNPLAAPQPFDHPFNVVLTMGVGPDAGWNAVSDSTDLPGEYEIDYVKAWK